MPIIWNGLTPLHSASYYIQHWVSSKSTNTLRCAVACEKSMYICPCIFGTTCADHLQRLSLSLAGSFHPDPRRLFPDKGNTNEVLRCLKRDSFRSFHMSTPLLLVSYFIHPVGISSNRVSTPPHLGWLKFAWSVSVESLPAVKLLSPFWLGPETSWQLPAWNFKSGSWSAG